ncbi:MAG: hypothetical protein LBJ02_09935 [Bifidobacteriaceae bacterium]|nr:hypothetical protein [Bifidobacteriaceae bacterium]
MATSMCALLLAFALPAVRAQAATDRLTAADAVYFSVSYTEVESVAPASAPALKDAWLRAVESGGGYSAVYTNPPVSTSHDGEVLLAIGQFAEAFGIDKSVWPEGTALVGADFAREYGDSPIFVDGESVPISGVFARGYSFRDPWNVWGSADGLAVVRLRADRIVDMGPAAFEEAVTRTVLLRPSQAAVDDYVAHAADAGLLLIPKSLDDQPTTLLGVSQPVAQTLVMSAAFLTLALMACGTWSAHTARRSRRELAIRRLHGASVAQIAARHAAYCGFSVAMPFGLAAVAASLILPFDRATGIVVASTITLVLWAGLTVASVRAGTHGEIGPALRTKGREWT